MKFYLSNSVGNTRQGGSSLSGKHFLKMLDAYYNEDICTISDSAHNSISQLFKFKFIPTENNLENYSVRSLAKFLIKAFFNIAFCRRRYQFDCKEEEVIVFVNSFTNILERVDFSNYSSIKFVGVIRGDCDSFVKDENIKYNFDWATSFLRSIDVPIFVSQGIKDNWSPFVTAKAYYLPNSIDELPQGDPIELPRGKFNIAVVGSIQHRKGQWRLLELCSRFDFDNVLFHVIGGASSEADATSVIDDFGSHPCIVFHGHQRNISAFLAASSVGMLLSESEAFPRTVAEYLFHSLPVITTNVSGSIEMVEHGFNGFVVDKHSPQLYDELAHYIRELANNSAMCVSFGERSKDIYQENYSAEVQYRRLREILDDL